MSIHPSLFHFVVKINSGRKKRNQALGLEKLSVYTIYIIHKFCAQTQTKHKLILSPSPPRPLSFNSNNNIKYNTRKYGHRFNVKLPNRYVTWGMSWFSHLHTGYEPFIDGPLINRHTGNCCIKEKFWYFALFRGISYLFPETLKKIFLLHLSTK